MALPLLSFYDKYFAQIKVLVMNEREVVVYFDVAFETRKFTVNREAVISHVMSIDSLLFNLDVDLI